MNSSFLSNIVLIDRFKCEEQLKKLRQSVDRKRWEWILPTSINAYYRRSFNDISKSSVLLSMISSYSYLAFTAAILQTPFFNKDAPK